MEQLKQYLLRLILLSLIQALLQSIQQNGPTKELTKVVCGLVIILTAFSPICNFDLSGNFEQFLSLQNTDDTAARTGEEYARSALSEHIISGTEAYILDKATALNISIDASVSVSSDDIPIPTSVIVSGNVNATERNALMEILTDQLGITKENIIWIG